MAERARQSSAKRIPSLNIGAAVKTSLDAARILLFDPIGRLERDRGVTFEPGRKVGTTPTELDGQLIALLDDNRRCLGKRDERTGLDFALSLPLDPGLCGSWRPALDESENYVLPGAL